MPQLGVILGIDATIDSIVGPPIDDALRTEAGLFINLESGGLLQLDLPPFLSTEANETLMSEASEILSTE